MVEDGAIVATGFVAERGGRPLCSPVCAIQTAWLSRIIGKLGVTERPEGANRTPAQLRRQRPISCVMIMSTLLVALTVYGPSIAAGFGVGFAAGYFVRAMVAPGDRRRRGRSEGQSIPHLQSIQHRMKPPQVASSSTASRPLPELADSPPSTPHSNDTEQAAEPKQLSTERGRRRRSGKRDGKLDRDHQDATAPDSA
jgi:hypothetical protein